MSEFEEVFGDWGLHEDGTPYSVQVTPPAGEGAWGPVPGQPVTITCPVFQGTRIIRAADGNEKASSATLYVPTEYAAALVVGAAVTIDDTLHTKIIRVDHPDAFLIFAFLVAYCE